MCAQIHSQPCQSRDYCPQLVRTLEQLLLEQNLTTINSQIRELLSMLRHSFTTLQNGQKNFMWHEVTTEDRKLTLRSTIV